MVYELLSLPYEYSVLEPYIDAQTMHVHHTGHHRAYVDKLNDALSTFEGSKDLLALHRTMSNNPVAIRNNGGGHYNHSLFWKWMAPVGSSNSGPTGELKIAIHEAFGSIDEMKKQFTAAAISRFGSGWAWLGVRDDGNLEITSTPNQDNPLMKGIVETEMIPILGLDVWEHAYYLKYQNKRAEYIQQWWNVVNWDNVVECFDKYASKGYPVPL